jgi:hypothetical protein
MFAFRLKFLSDSSLNSEEISHHFSIDGREVILGSSRGGVMSGAKDFSIFSYHFESVDSARNFGLRLKRAISISSVFSHIGFDVGSDYARTMVGESFKRFRNGDEIVEIMDDVHGLCVFEQSIKRTFLGFSASAERSVSLSGFLDGIFCGLKYVDGASDRIVIASRLLSSAYYEESQLAKFTLAIASIESLASQEIRNDDEIKLLEIAVQSIKNSDFKISSKEKNISMLRNQKRESVRSACKKLIELHLPADYAKKFNSIYDKRNKILHGGEIIDDMILSNMAHEVCVTSRLLIRSILESGRYV